MGQFQITSSYNAMRERQAEYHGNQYEKVDLCSNGQKSKKENTTSRKELAKIANTSEGSIQRTKYILENGTKNGRYEVFSKHFILSD